MKINQIYKNDVDTENVMFACQSKTAHIFKFDITQEIHSFTW